MFKIGLLVGREWSFPPAFIEEVNKRDQGVTAEFVRLGGTRMDEVVPYALIIDRISHEVPYYRSYLKHAVLTGTHVVNNPFMWTADDKFFGASLITKLGVASPRTVVLPNKEYVPGIKHDESLRNLVYPMPWEEIAEYVGMPCILKDAHGGGWKDVYVCNTLDELIAHYNESGRLTMVVQEFIKWDHFVRCLCIGQEEILPIKYDPKERKYHVEHDHLSPELGARVVDDARKIVRALGYDMNSIEFAIRDGIPYAIDFMNPAPDMDVNSLTPHYFEWVVNAMADMAIRLAKKPRRQTVQSWEGLFVAGNTGAQMARPAGARKAAAPKPATKQAEAEAKPASPPSRSTPPSKKK
ncbi:MAG TPA: hypothetical protein VGC44_08650 [Longimicrobiales bacterium]